MDLKIPAYIRSVPPYVPGKPIEELEREYGIAGSIKLASNENPLGTSPKALAAIADACRSLHRYPDGAAFELTRRLARHLQVEPQQIVLGNGSDDLLGMLGRVLLQPGDEVLVPSPSFLMYTIVAQCAGALPVLMPLKAGAADLERMQAAIGPRTRLIFLCNPNNPTGAVLRQTELESFLSAVPRQVAVVLDEAYFEFVRDAACVSGIGLLPRYANLVTLRTFSKAYGLAGLRVGYGVMDPSLAQLVQRVRMPFNVNSLAQAAAAAALDDTDFLTQTIAAVHQGLDMLYAQLGRRGLRCLPTQANFFLLDVGRAAEDVFESLLRQGVIVRSMKSYGYPNYIRISVGRDEENRRLLDALDKVLETKPKNK